MKYQVFLVEDDININQILCTYLRNQDWAVTSFLTGGEARQALTQWGLNLKEAAVEGSRQQWSVAMENLLDNQMRYAQSRVEITLNVEEESSDSMKLRVFNDGPAIDEDLLEQIFDPYSSGKDGQFGLGLAITKQVMDMHNTRIRACNEEQGVAFYIEE